MPDILGISFEARVPPAYFGGGRPMFAAALRRGLSSLREHATYLRVRDPHVLPEGDRHEGLLSARVVTSYLGPCAQGLGIVQTVTPRYEEPFHAALSMSVLDLTTDGGAGLCIDPRTCGRADRAFGLVMPETGTDAQAAELVEAVRSLWLGWDADAIIKDKISHRYIDRRRVHFSDFIGEHFRVRGPSTMPRPKQGLPPVFVALSSAAVPERLLAAADIAILPALAEAELSALVERVRNVRSAAGAGPCRLILSMDVRPDPAGWLPPVRHGLVDAGLLSRLGIDGIEISVPIEALLEREGLPERTRPQAAMRERFGLPEIAGPNIRSAIAEGRQL